MSKLIRICFYIQLALLAIAFLHPIDRQAILPLFHIIYILLITLIGFVIYVAAIKMKVAKVPFSTFDLTVIFLNLVLIAPIIPMIIFFIVML